MTSKSLFWVRSKENHKRRGWVWIISLLIQLAVYPGIMVLYLTRIRTNNMRGLYSAEIFRDKMFDAAADALGFKSQAPWAVMILAVIIGIQGFSYLYSRKKVDMYYSTPVSAKSRFTVVYINGIIIYIVSYLLSIILAVGFAVINGAMNGRAFAECALAFLLNILFFLVIYNAAILAVMLTGNIIITGGVTVFLLGIGFAAEIFLGDMKENFFRTADSFFTTGDGMFSRTGIKFCVLTDYFNDVYFWKTESSLSVIIKSIVPLYFKWLVFAVVFGILAYLFYRKRPAEAAGKAIAFPVIKPVIKSATAVTAGIAICNLIYSAVFRYGTNTELSVGNIFLICGSAVLVVLLCCGAMEAVYEFDVRAAIKHITSTCVSVVIVIAIFCIYYFDIFGYDRYIPKPEQVESAAVFFFYEQNYRYIEGQDGAVEYSKYISEPEYLEDNMFLTDSDAICALIQRSGEMCGNTDSMADERNISILFRLKSGKQISRRYTIDFADPANEEILNKIVGTKEFREGYYQIFKAEDIIQKYNWKTSYSNGMIDTEIRVDTQKLREAWMKDMEQFDFSLARNSRQCGYLSFALSPMDNIWYLPVYNGFENTIACLEDEEFDVTSYVQAEDIASITVIKWDRDSTNQDSSVDGPGAVTYDTAGQPVRMMKIYDEPQEIAEIIKTIYPEDMRGGQRWNDNNGFEADYDVMISLKADTEYRYDYERYGYRFIKGQVPDFVEENLKKY